jgi:hypothetical protein
MKKHMAIIQVNRSEESEEVTIAILNGAKQPKEDGAEDNEIFFYFQNKEEIDEYQSNDKDFTVLYWDGEERTVRLESDHESIYIECPNPSCDHWEEMSINSPRKNLSALPIIKWHRDYPNGMQCSLNECGYCRKRFNVLWDYNNPMSEQ